jgi:hypothetical protein
MSLTARPRKFDGAVTLPGSSVQVSPPSVDL